MAKKLIYAFVGRTGVGKDTVANEVCRRKGIDKVISYTDAPMRSDQKNGREHFFLTHEEMDQVLDTQHVIAYTKIGDNRYCATLEQLEDRPMIYIIDPKGISYIREHFRDEIDLKVFYIYAPEQTRRQRTASRKNFDFDVRNKAENDEFVEFCKYENYVFVMNNGSLETAVKRVLENL